MGRFSDTWYDLALALGVPAPVAEACLTELLAGYGEAARDYHTARHIVALLDHMEGLAFTDPDVARLAIFFHDLVYDPSRSDNEVRSAEALRRCLGNHIAADRLERACAMIVATASHKATGDADTDLMLDLDMAILGQPWPVYEAYARGVMAEYVPVYGEAAYRHGRVQLFITPTLARPTLFLTEPFQTLDAQARDNLRREQAWLAA